VILDHQFAASTAAIASGLSNKEAEISKRGGDWRQVQAQSSTEAIETARMEVARLVEIQKMVNAANAAAPGLNLNWAQVATLGGAASAPGAYLQAATGNQVAVAMPTAKPEDDTKPEPNEEEEVTRAEAAIMVPAKSDDIKDDG
jgi:hypothetical protein